MNSYACDAIENAFVDESAKKWAQIDNNSIGVSINFDFFALFLPCFIEYIPLMKSG